MTPFNAIGPMLASSRISTYSSSNYIKHKKGLEL